MKYITVKLTEDQYLWLQLAVGVAINEEYKGSVHEPFVRRIATKLAQAKS